MAPRHHIPMSQRWATLITGRPWMVLASCAGIAIGCAALAVVALDIKASRNELLPDDLPFNQRYLDWAENFRGTYDIVVVADTQSADGRDQTERTQAFMHELAHQLDELPAVERIVYGAPEEDTSPAAARLLPMSAFRDVLDDAQQARPMLESATVSQLLSESVRSLSDREDDDHDETSAAQGIDQLRELILAIHHALRGDDARDALAAAGSASKHAERNGRNWTFLTSPNGRFLFMRMTPHYDAGNINALGDAVAIVRARVNDVKAQFPGVKAGLTGVEVIEADETDAATRDATMASIAALLAITALLVFSFRGFRTPALLIITLVIGIAWSFGYLVLAVGHLQILSVIFVLVLLGLGIDFGIHFVSAFEAARQVDDDDRTPARDSAFTDALARAGRRSFPSIALGALTTAVAFGTTAFTDFLGVAELGIIAAGGIVLCLLATFTALPALVCILHPTLGLAGRRVAADRHRPPRDLLRVVHDRPALTLGAAAVFLALCAWFASHIQFDYDLMRLQPKGVESVEWQNTLLREGGVSAWFAISIVDDLEEARVRTRQLAELPTVGQVSGIGLLVAPDEPDKLELVRTARRELQPSLATARTEQAGTPFSPAAEAQALASQLVSLRAIFRPQLERDDLPAEVRSSMTALGSALDDAIDTASSLNPTTFNARVGHLHDAYVALRRETAARLDQLLSTDPLTPGDLPAELLRPYIDDSDPGDLRYAIEIHPDPPENVTNALDPAFLPRFVDEIRSIDPDVTGVLMQIYYTGSLMVRSYVFAGALAIVLVIGLLTITRRSLYDALLCVVPVALGFGAVLAAMDLTDHSLNAANIIVLPLMFGIGVDSGVHVIHRFRQHPHDRPLGLAHGTGKGIIVTCLTTVIGFGAMLLARHRGIQSLGLVMSLGITLTLLACLIVLPSWLEVRTRSSESRR